MPRALVRRGRRATWRDRMGSRLSLRLLRSRWKMYRDWGRALRNIELGEVVSGRYYQVRDQYNAQRTSLRVDPLLAREHEVLCWLKDLLDDV